MTHGWGFAYAACVRLLSEKSGAYKGCEVMGNYVVMFFERARWGMQIIRKNPVCPSR